MTSVDGLQKISSDKFHLVVTTDPPTSININCWKINNSAEENLLGIKSDFKLSFENHVSHLYKKASQKLHTLTRIVNCIDLSKRKALKETFF